MAPRLLRVALERGGPKAAGRGVRAGLQLHAGGEAAAGPAQAAVQGGPEGAARVLGEDDGGAAEVQGARPRLQGQLAAVVAPRAVGRRHDRLAVGRDRGHVRVEDIVPEVLLRGVLDLRVAAGEDGKEALSEPGVGSLQPKWKGPPAGLLHRGLGSAKRSRPKGQRRAEGQLRGHWRDLPTKGNT